MKKQLVLLGLSSMMLLTSCRIDSTSSSPSSSSSSSSTSSSSSSSSSVVTGHTVKYVADSEHKDTEVTFHHENRDATEYKATDKIAKGTTVLVNIYSPTETVTGGFANDVALSVCEAFDTYYQFTMPDKDVTVTVTYASGHTVTYAVDSAHPDTEVTVHHANNDLTEYLPTDKIAEGTTVLVNVWSDSERITGAFANDTALTASTTYPGYYEFTMPNEDVVITLSYKSGSQGGEESDTYSLTYNADSAHTGTFVTFLTKSQLDGMLAGTYSGDGIKSAKSGDTVYVMTSTEETINGVYYNGTLATKDESYGWMLSSFTMPSEKVTITVTYAA